MNINLNNLKIPSIPLVTIQVIMFDANHKDASSYALEKIITPDKSICAELLKIANSSYYGRSGTIKTLKDAIILLGLKNAKNAILLLSSRNLHQEINDNILKKYMDDLPLLTALISYDLATVFKLQEEKEDIFLASLLQKIGICMLGVNFKDSYAQVLKKSEQRNVSLSSIERETLGTDHISIGHQIFEIWKIPDLLLESMINQEFLLDMKFFNSLTHVSRVSSLSNIIARKLIGIPVSMDDLVREELIFNYYHATEKIKEKFFSSYYYELIIDHPFYRAAA